LDGLKQTPLRLTQSSELQADAAYTDYLIEDMLAENGIRLSAHRKSNSKKKLITPVRNILYLCSVRELKLLSVILPSIYLKIFMQ
jgi:hypothetical protein